MKITAAFFFLSLYFTLSLALQQGGPCPPGGGSYCAAPFSPYIYRCYANGSSDYLSAGNCNDNLAGVPPVGVKVDAICGNSSTDNAECYLPPYPDFIHVPGQSTSSSSSSSTTTTVTSTATQTTTATTTVAVSTTTIILPTTIVTEITTVITTTNAAGSTVTTIVVTPVTEIVPATTEIVTNQLNPETKSIPGSSKMPTASSTTQVATNSGTRAKRAGILVFLVGIVCIAVA